MTNTQNTQSVKTFMCENDRYDRKYIVHNKRTVVVQGETQTVAEIYQVIGESTMYCMRVYAGPNATDKGIFSTFEEIMGTDTGVR